MECVEGEGRLAYRLLVHNIIHIISTDTDSDARFKCSLLIKKTINGAHNTKS